MSRPLGRSSCPTLLLAASLLALPAAQSTPVERAGELRGLWVVRSSLTSPTSISRMIEGAHAAGFNTVLVQVRGRGDAYYASDLEPRAEALAAETTAFDPLDDTLRQAHARGMAVVAWVTVNLVASAHDLPRAPTHVVNRAPDWLMVPRALAQELAGAAPHSPGYVGRIARWTRTHSSDLEGLYTSPVHPAAAAHTVSVVADLVRRYAVDGVHLDYVRYPGADFDYSRAALEEFRHSVLPDLSRQGAAALDVKRRDDALAYADMFPQRWVAFRRSRLTALVMRIRDAVRRHRPNASLSAAVVPDAGEAVTVKLQEWTRWLDTGLLDAACPMAYTPDPVQFDAQIRGAVSAAGTGEIWAGIGAYRLTPDQTIDRIASARRLGASGVVLFSYDSLVEPAQPLTYLADVGRAAFPKDISSSGGSR
jgi:uncharacterized lipoprotein YddW (UPF0748 family)